MNPSPTTSVAPDPPAPPATTLPPPALPPGASLDPEGRLVTELQCVACGYVLRGLRPDDTCPECGEAVGRSLGGDRLRFADARWLGKLRTGGRILSWSLVVYLAARAWHAVLSFTAVGGGPMDWRWLGAVELAAGAVFFIGLWRITTPDPGRRLGAQPHRWMKVARIAEALGLAGGGVVLALRLGVVSPSTMTVAAWEALFYGANAANLVSWVALLIVLGWLARRGGGAKLARWLALAKWCGGVDLGLFMLGTVMQDIGWRLLLPVVRPGGLPLSAWITWGEWISRGAWLLIWVFYVGVLVMLFRLGRLVRAAQQNQA